MLPQSRHGWHLRGARQGGLAADEVNLKLVLAACALAIASSVPIAIVLAALGGGVRART